MSVSNPPKISVKVEPDLKKKLEHAASELQIGEASLVRACVTALLNYVEQNREITIPFIVIPRSIYNELNATQEIYDELISNGLNPPPYAARIYREYQVPPYNK